MATSLCSSCRNALRQGVHAIRQNRAQSSVRPGYQQAISTTALRRSIQSSRPTPLDPATLLSKPTWSVASLLPTTASTTSTESPITKEKLHHLLRLSALPLPQSGEEEASMIATLQSQLHFVRDIQSVDTTGVEPLRSIRDETIPGIREATIGLKDLEEALGKEVKFGHKKRPRRVKGERVDTIGAEDWEPLKTASRTAGKYFVVKSGKE